MAYRSLKTLSVGILIGSALMCGSCGSSLRETFPERSATEQLLITTAADRAIEKLPRSFLRGKTVFIDAYLLKSYDRDYVIQKLRDTVLHSGGKLVEEDAEIIIEIASGALSIDSRSSLFGIPEFPLPIPLLAEPVKFPEIALFKTTRIISRAKILVSAREGGETGGALAFPVPILLGTSELSERWILLAGPFRSSDLPKELQ